MHSVFTIHEIQKVEAIAVSWATLKAEALLLGDQEPSSWLR